MLSRKIIFALVLGLMSSCRPIAERIIPPAPTPIYVWLPVEIHPRFRGDLTDCAAEQPDVALLVNYNASLNLPDLRFQLGESEDGFSGFAALLGWEEIVVIANPQTKIEKLHPGDLAQYFIESPTRFEVWAYPVNHPVRELFDREMLRGSSLTPYANLAPNIDAMLEMVGNRENAIGYLPASWVTKAITVVEMDQQPQSFLRLPVIGITDSEPEGAVRAILVCMQGKLE